MRRPRNRKRNRIHPPISGAMFTHIIAGLMGYGLAKLGMPLEDALALANRSMAKSYLDEMRAAAELAKDEAEADFLLGLS